MLASFVLSRLCGATAITCGAQSSITSAGSYAAQSCLFSCLSSTNGGAVYISSTSSNYSSKDCIFTGCHASADGAGFYISVSNSVISTTCGFNCYAGTSGQFFYSSASVSGKYYRDSSSFCANSSVTSAYDANYFINGNHAIIGFNTSYNYIQNDASGIIIFSSTSTLNEATVAGCYSYEVTTHFDSATTSISSMNFINNSQSASNAGLIFSATSSTTNYYSSVFCGNSGYILFCVSSGTITVHNSSVSHSLGYGITGTYFVSCSFTSASSIAFASNAFSLSGRSCIYERVNMNVSTNAFTVALFISANPLAILIAFHILISDN